MRHLLLWLFLLGSLRAQNTTWGVEADFNSRYIWRGIAYTNGPVFQPSFWVTVRGTTVSMWSSMVLDNEAHRGYFDQLFFTVSRELGAGGWRIAPALQGYTWQGLGGESTANALELSGRLSHPLGPVYFVSTQTVDVASFRGAFIADAGVEWKRSARRWSFVSSATAALANYTFNRTYVGADHAGMNYLQFALSATRKSPGGWYVRPHVEVVTIVSDSVSRALGNRALANAGLAFGREF